MQLCQISTSKLTKLFSHLENEIKERERDTLTNCSTQNHYFFGKTKYNVFPRLVIFVFFVARSVVD